MTRSLHALLGQVKLASVQLMATSNQITATVRQQEATVTEFRASTNDVVTATREISVTAQALEQTVEEVSTVTAENALVAGEGKADLEKMRGSMGLLATTSSNVATRLRAMGAVSLRTLDGVQEHTKFPLPKGLKTDSLE